MTTLRTYRHLLAAFLLAVYGFIAAPVQFWHHHQDISDNRLKTVFPDTKNDTVSHNSNVSSETNCQICSHKYSTYNDDALIPFEASIILRAAKNGSYDLQLVSTSSFSLPNRGPPVLS